MGYLPAGQGSCIVHRFKLMSFWSKDMMKKGVVSLYSFIGNGVLSQYMCFNINTSYK